MLGRSRWGLLGALALAACDTRVERSDSPANAGTGADSPGGSTASAGASGNTAAGGAAGAEETGAAGMPAALDCAGDAFAWPNAAKAAVSLTYDDGLPSHLSNALPALEDAGLVATFFLSEGYSGFEQRKPEYQALVAKGFEMAAHTVRHPCFGLTPDLADYDEATLAAELDQNMATMRELGMIGELTFAYPCGNTTYGDPPVSYVPLIEERFFAARGVNCSAQAPAAVDLYNVNTCWPPETATADDVTTQVDQAIAAGTWLVFGFHAVGAAAGEWSPVPQPAHDALVAHLVANQSDLWVATFASVADYVERCR